MFKKGPSLWNRSLTKTALLVPFFMREERLVRSRSLSEN